MSALIKLTLPDSTEITAEKNSSVFDIIGKIGKGLQKAAIAAEVNGVAVDLTSVVDSDARFNVITFDSPAGQGDFLAFGVAPHGPGGKEALSPCEVRHRTFY